MDEADARDGADEGDDALETAGEPGVERWPWGGCEWWTAGREGEGDREVGNDVDSGSAVSRNRSISNRSN